VNLEDGGKGWAREQSDVMDWKRRIQKPWWMYEGDDGKKEKYLLRP
jgi:hypothetical protein